MRFEVSCDMRLCTSIWGLKWDTSHQIALSKVQKWLREGSGWLIESVDSIYINISVYNPLAGSPCIQLIKELKHSRKDLINIQIEDNECFRWCHIRHLNLINQKPEQNKKSDEEMIANLDYNKGFLYLKNVVMRLD